MTLYRLRPFFWTLLVVLLDQVTKAAIRASMLLYDSVPVLGDLVRLTYVRNTGAGFSLSIGSDGFNRAFFMAINILAGVLLGWLILTATKSTHRFCFALILGGDIGNLLDRIFQGGVTDFLDCDFPDFIMQRWPIFNVADSSIFIALVVFIVYSVFFEKKASEAS